MFRDHCYPLNFLECFLLAMDTWPFPLCFSYFLFLSFYLFFLLYYFFLFLSRSSTWHGFLPSVAFSFQLPARFHLHLRPLLLLWIHLSQSLPNLSTALFIAECYLLPFFQLASFCDPVCAQATVSTLGEEWIHLLLWQESAFQVTAHLPP